RMSPPTTKLVQYMWPWATSRMGPRPQVFWHELFSMKFCCRSSRNSPRSLQLALLFLLLEFLLQLTDVIPKRRGALRFPSRSRLGLGARRCRIVGCRRFLRPYRLVLEELVGGGNNLFLGLIAWLH